MCVPSGFTGLSSSPSFWTSKHLRPLAWQKADLCAAQICPLFLNVMYSLSGKARNKLSSLAPGHLTTTLLSRIGGGGWGSDAVFLPDDRGNHVPTSWRGDRGPTGLTLSLLFVVPLRDLDLITIFIAASFCVAFFSFTVNGKANSSC